MPWGYIFLALTDQYAEIESTKYWKLLVKLLGIGHQWHCWCHGARNMRPSEIMFLLETSNNVIKIVMILLKDVVTLHGNTLKTQIKTKCWDQLRLWIELGKLVSLSFCLIILICVQRLSFIIGPQHSSDVVTSPVQGYICLWCLHVSML